MSQSWDTSGKRPAPSEVLVFFFYDYNPVWKGTVMFTLIKKIIAGRKYDACVDSLENFYIKAFSEIANGMRNKELRDQAITVMVNHEKEFNNLVAAGQQIKNIVMNVVENASTKDWSDAVALQNIVTKGVVQMESTMKGQLTDIETAFKEIREEIKAEEAAATPPQEAWAEEAATV
jgi:hypothetical protein